MMNGDYLRHFKGYNNTDSTLFHSSRYTYLTICLIRTILWIIDLPRTLAENQAIDTLSNFGTIETNWIDESIFNFYWIEFSPRNIR